MGAIEDRKNHGGLGGVACADFKAELAKAFGDREHYLRPFIDTQSEERRWRLLSRTLKAACDEDKHPLHRFALLFWKMPALSDVIESTGAEFEKREVGYLLENKKMDLEDAVKIAGWMDADAMRQKVRKGGRDGGNKRAGQTDNGTRDIGIRASRESVSKLAEIYRLTPRRIRQIRGGS